MPKRILAKAKKLFSSILTLIIIGAFVVSPMMPLVAAAEEVVETPVVLETPVVSETSETVEEVVVEVPVEAEVTVPELSDSEVTEEKEVKGEVEEVVEIVEDTATTTLEIVIAGGDSAGVGATSTEPAMRMFARSADNSNSFAISGEFGGNTSTTTDTTAPTAPVIVASSHGENASSTATTTMIVWSNSTDDTALAGYSFLWDGIATSAPDVTVDGLATTTTTELGVGTWFFHLIALDAAGNASSPVTHYGPIYIVTNGSTTTPSDTTAPTAPVIISSSHPLNATSTAATTTISWLASTDNVGVAGYSFIWDNASTTDPDNTVDAATSTIRTEILSEGTWWFHIKALDTAGNVSTTTHYGPITIELPPVEITNIRITDVTQTSAVIRWTTNRPATSRVIYDTVSHPDISSFSAPNFGYASSTNEVDLAPNKVAEHAVLVTGLVPGTTYYFRVLSKGSPLAISGEFGGGTSSGGCVANCGGNNNNGGNNNQNQTGGQGNFTTLPANNTGNSSGQGVFTTLPTGGSSSSGQGSFTTLAVNTGSSGQGSFTTLSSGGGCTTNCGGGGGGGGGGGSRRQPPVTVPELPAACPVYLLKYIQLGADNDPVEVRKLEVFLNDFEGFSLQINGIYEPADFEAVKIFQTRYGVDVLNPWGLATNDPTGYVYITTTYAINQIYCARTTANDFDFRTFGFGGGAGVVNAAELPEATTTATTTAEATTTPNRLLLAAIGALDFIKDNWCWIFPLILLLIILILAIELWREKRKNDSLEESLEELEEMASEGEPTLFEGDDSQPPLV